MLAFIWCCNLGREYYRVKSFKDAFLATQKEYNEKELDIINLAYCQMKVIDEMKNNFMDCRISHIVAISGMHIGIILITVDNILDTNLKNKRLKY